MLVGYKVLALRLALLIEESGKKRLTISERRLKTLASAENKKPVEENKEKKEPQEEVKAENASEENNNTQETNHFKSEKDEKSQKEVLSIRYLSNLRDELELLGYFIGSLAGGGYGLLVISSLEGSFSLATELAESDDFFKLNEKGLQRRLDDRLKQKTQRRKKDTTVTREEINALVWMGLADLAKKRLPIVYGDLAEELGLKNAHYNTFKRPLEQITAFCMDKGLPLLSHLVVRQDTALPASVKFKNRDNNVKQHNVELEKHKEDVKKIAAVDWNEHQASFEAFVKAKSKSK